MFKDNVAFVQKTKEILKDMGVEVKTTQLYEMYSKLLGEKNWNIAKSKDLKFLDSVKAKFPQEESTEELVKKFKDSGTEKVVISKKEEYLQKNLVDLVKDINLCDAQAIITILLEGEGHKVTEVDYRIDEHGVSHEVEWNSGEKVIVLTRSGLDGANSSNSSITAKHMRYLKKAMDISGSSRGIIFTSDVSVVDAIYKVASDQNIDIVDREDLLRMAYKFEYKKRMSL